ncbi:MAG: alpha-galactosidase [Clostridiales bacterium]|nr:alpha-galactosidase [Clostridiales bacterium]
MILYDQTNQIFHLQGLTFSYILSVYNGVLMHMYWGKKLPEGDHAGLFVLSGEAASFDPPCNRHPREVLTQEKGYFGQRSLNLINTHGDDVLSLRYEGHRVFAGKKKLQGLPASYVESDAEADTLEIDLRDALTGAAVTLSYTVFHDFDVLARSMVIRNESDQPMTLTEVQTSVPLPMDDYEIIHLKGAWARERFAQRIPMPQGTFSISSRRGASSHENNPFLALVKPHTTEHGGDVYAMTHVYSGSFSASVDVGIDAAPRMMMGLCSDVFSWQLEPGAAFQAPETLLTYAHDGLNGLSHRMHAFIRQRICRGMWRDQSRPILINNWEATYFDFNSDKLVEIARRGAEIGCELFVIDDGWFGKRNADNCSLGDWVVNENKLPGGLKTLAERINALGLQVGLWFEPEMVSPDSDLYRAHPDWCLHVEGRERTTARNQLILDVSRKEVQDYIIESVSSVLRSAPISYVKWDMNRNMMEGFSAALPAAQRMETQHRYMLGLYRVLEEITSAFPKVLFESCSGGGGRFDCGMLHYMPQTWTSDDTDASERVRIQYGTSLIYPCSSMGAHVSAVPNHQTGRTTPFHTRCNVAMGGNFGFELNLNKISEEELRCAKDAVATVKKLRTTMQQGEYSRLVNPLTSNGRSAWQFTDDERVIVCIYQDYASPNPQPWHVKLTGLDENVVYVDEAHGLRCSGGALMSIGIPVPRAWQDHESWIYCFEKA